MLLFCWGQLGFKRVGGRLWQILICLRWEELVFLIELVVISAKHGWELELSGNCYAQAQNWFWYVIDVLKMSRIGIGIYWCFQNVKNWYWYFIDVFKMSRIGIGILLTKSELSELVLVLGVATKLQDKETEKMSHNCSILISFQEKYSCSQKN